MMVDGCLEFGERLVLVGATVLLCSRRRTEMLPMPSHGGVHLNFNDCEPECSWDISSLVRLPQAIQPHSSCQAMVMTWGSPEICNGRTLSSLDCAILPSSLVS